MRELSSDTTLPAPPAVVWESVCDPAVLQRIAWPLFRITPLDPPAFPAHWEARDYRARLKLFGVFPFGWQVIGPRFPKAAPGEYTLVDQGRSPLFRHWEHRIHLTPAADGGTSLTDHVRFDAGPLTAPAALGLKVFFSHRHRRLRRVLAKGL